MRPIRVHFIAPFFVAVLAGCGGGGGTPASVEPPDDTTPPSVPADVEAARIPGTCRVLLTWSASLDDVGVEQYAIAVDAPEVPFYYFAGAVTSDTSYVLVAPPVWAVTNVLIRARDVRGNWSAYSDTARITVEPSAAELSGWWTSSYGIEETAGCPSCGSDDSLAFEILADSSIVGTADWTIVGRSAPFGGRYIAEVANIPVSGRFDGKSVTLLFAATAGIGGWIDSGRVNLEIDSWPESGFDGARLVAVGSFDVYGKTSVEPSGYDAGASHGTIHRPPGVRRDAPL